MLAQRMCIPVLFLALSCGVDSSSDDSTTDASQETAEVDATPDVETADTSRPEDSSRDADVSSDGSVTDTVGDTAEDRATPIYVTLAGHIEAVDAWANCRPYSGNRDGLMAFMERFAETGAKLNLQIDRPFLLGAGACETDEMIEDYAGTRAFNVVDYLVRAHGVEIDAHRSGGYEAPEEPNYADVRQLAGEITRGVTEVVGGFIWDDPDQLPRLNDGETGYLDETTLTWFPEILTMGAGGAHHDGDFSDDDRTSGVWIPAGPLDDFYTHDSDSRMAYVGPGLHHFNWNPNRCQHDFATPADYINVLLDYIDQGVIPAGKIYTLSIGVPQGVLFGDLEEQEMLFDALQELQPLVDEGSVIFASYTEVVDIWRTDYDAEPNIFTFDQIDPDDYTCPE